MTQTTRHEDEILLRIARKTFNDEDQAELLKLLRYHIEWNYVIETANRHRLIPLLHRHLLAAVPNLPVSGSLQDLVLQNTQASLLIIGRLKQLHEAFASETIPIMVLKGPVLSHLAYDDPHMRQAGDIDLLIHPQDFFKATAVLKQLRYEMNPTLTPSQEASHRKLHCEIDFVRDDGSTVVDLHWGLVPKTFDLKLDTTQMFERAQPVTILGLPVATLGNEDTLLYQCVHGAKHLWVRLEWISTIAELLRSQDLDCSTLVSRAFETRTRKILGLGLRLAQHLSPIDVSPKLLTTLDPDNSMQRLASTVFSRIFTPRDVSHVSADMSLQNLRIMDRKMDAIASLAKAVFVPTLSDWQTFSLPRQLHWMYYPLRPLRLSKSYALLAWKQLFN